jgi:hypothetical protein
VQDDIKKAAQSFKGQTSSLSDEESAAHFEQQRESYEREYSAFIKYYGSDEWDQGSEYSILETFSDCANYSGYSIILLICRCVFSNLKKHLNLY